MGIANLLQGGFLPRSRACHTRDRTGGAFTVVGDSVLFRQDDSMDVPTEGFQAFSPGTAATADTSDGAARITRRILDLLFGPPEGRAFAVRLWNGLVEAPDRREPDFTLVLKHPGALRRMFIPATELNLAESYMRDDFDVEGSLERATLLADDVAAVLGSKAKLARMLWKVLSLPRTSAALGDTRRFRRFERLPHYVLRHSKARDAEAISFMYDTSNEFYALWLGTRMVYTCGYFRQATDTLDEAQTNKLELVCRKLRLKPGERLLDLGCGWGALMEYAAERHGVTAHGVSLSAEQVEYANARFARAGLADRCRAEVRDYRTLVSEPPYDKISAVGIIEHIGIRKFPVFFSLVNRLLVPGGLFLNHGSTYVHEQPAAPGEIGSGKPTRQHNAFIQKYIFPDAEAPVISEIVQETERAGLEVRDVENLREHYPLTLRHWLANLEARRDDAVRLIGEEGYRAFRLYLAAFPPRYDHRHMHLVQVLSSKPEPTGRTRLPMTRDHVYHDAAEVLGR